ncbi:MAG: DUF4388 domain-containing protein [Thermodesulfobacteriota bacterium]
MELKGSFEPASLASILQLLSNEERTGALRLTNGESEVKIFLKQGEVICAMGSQKETRLGTLLTRDGLISAKDLAYCLTLASEQKKALGSVLVEKGLISEETLKQTILKQAQEVIFNMFVWKKGEFDYRDSDEVPRGALETKIDIMNIIMEGMRRIDELMYFMTQIPSDRVVMRLSDKAAEVTLPRLTEKERRILTLMDGKRSVRQVITASGFDDFTVYQILHEFVTSGLAEKTDEVFETKKAEAPDYSEIIMAYNDILQVIRKHLETELEKWLVTMFDEATDDPSKRDLVRRMHKIARNKWAVNIIESCKPQLVRKKRDIFTDFHPGNPVDENILAVTRSLAAVKDSRKGRFILAKSFSLFVGNLIKTVVDSFGAQACRSMLKELNQTVVAINESHIEFPEKQEIVKDMMDILLQVAQRFKSPPPTLRTGSILFVSRE